MTPNVRDILLWAGLFALLTTLQILFAPLLDISGVGPDFVLAGLYFLAFRKGAVPATVMGFSAGLFLDLASAEIVGISALAKTVTGFAAGQLYDPERPSPYGALPRFVLLGFLFSLLHNLVLILSYFRAMDTDTLAVLAAQGPGGALYSTLFIAAAVLIASRSRKRVSLQEAP